MRNPQHGKIHKRLEIERKPLNLMKILVKMLLTNIEENNITD